MRFFNVFEFLGQLVTVPKIHQQHTHSIVQKSIHLRDMFTTQDFILATCIAFIYLLIVVSIETMYPTNNLAPRKTLRQKVWEAFLIFIATLVGIQAAHPITDIILDNASLMNTPLVYTTDAPF